MQVPRFHKMLGQIRFSSLFPPVVFEWGCLLSLLLVAGAAFTWNREAVFFGGDIYFADGDCYARMTRVRMLEEHPLTPIRAHDFENYPLGITPHTTAPLDYLIAALAQFLRPFSSRPLALAGALISPVLGLATLLLMARWSRGMPFRWPMLWLAAISPMMAHAFLLGRPDHQSLLILMTAVALMAEISLWRERGRICSYISAVAWSFALWVSLFEPLILLGLVLLGRLARHFFNPKKSALLGSHAIGPFLVFCGILLGAWMWDGWRAARFDPHFSRWALNIGELRHATPGVLFSWAGWLLPVAPVILAWRFWRERDPVCLLLAGMLPVLGALTLWHMRWGYFLVLAASLCLPWVLGGLRWKWAAWTAFVVSLWPVAGEWDRMLYPDDENFRARVENVADAVALRDAALSLREMPGGGVLAPWWFCPAVVWWSGQPCVGGTSHQSLPGIVDSSEFFLSPDAGTEILARRRVRYIIAYDPDRVVSNALQILGREQPGNPLARRIFTGKAPENFQPIHTNQFFKVYAVSPGKF